MRYMQKRLHMMNKYPDWWDDPHAEEHGWLIQGWEVPGYPHISVHQVSEPSSGYALVFFLVAVLVLQQYKRWWKGEKE